MKHNLEKCLDFGSAEETHDRDLVIQHHPEYDDVIKLRFTGSLEPDCYNTLTRLALRLLADYHDRDILFICDNAIANAICLVESTQPTHWDMIALDFEPLIDVQSKFTFINLANNQFEIW